MDKNSQSFSYSEEAFLLASLHEVVKVWSRGSGQASFNLDISDGVADLKLSFKLGLPTEPHCDQSVLHEVPLKPHHYFQENVKQKRHKGQVRRDKDRARAAAHQARLQPKEAASQQTKGTAVPAVVKLPFSGNILPLKATKESLVVATPLVSSSVDIRTPRKSPAFKKYVDVSTVKKQLFLPNPYQLPSSAEPSSTSYSHHQLPPVHPDSAALSPPPASLSPPAHPPPSRKNNYTENEKQLWTSLFGT